MTELEVIDLGDGVVAVLGEVDAHSAVVLTDVLDSQVGDVVRVRLAKCTFMDSRGLRSLLLAHGSYEQQGRRLVVVEPSDVVLRLFELTALVDHFHFDDAMT